MSFLEPLGEGEAIATLEDVLAFIETCDTDGGASSSSSSSVALVPHARTAKKARATVSQSYRTRDEMLRLRREAVQLERRLIELKSGTDTVYEKRLAELQILNSHAHESKQWIELVLRAYKRRQESERTNRQLKALLDKQIQMIRATESAFGVFTNAVKQRYPCFSLSLYL